MRVREIGLVGLSIFVSLVCSEVLVRIYHSRHPGYELEIWRYASLAKQPVADQRLHAHVPNRELVLMGVPVSISSQGLRDREYPVPKPAGVCRYLALGDSFTFGWGVRAEESFVKLLEKNLNGFVSAASGCKSFELLNLGVGNYNTRQELATLEQEGGRFGASGAFLFFYINDAEPAQEGHSTPLSRSSYALALFGYRLAQLRSIIDHKLSWEPYYHSLYEGKSWLEYRALLHELASYAKARRLDLVPVLLTDLHELSRYPFRKEHARVAAAFAEEGFPAIDTWRDFEGRDGTGLWVAADDPHSNAVADRMIADSVARSLRERLWAPRSEFR